MKTSPPTTSNRRELNSHLRGGWIVLWLWQGSRLSDGDVARLCGMTRQGANKMMLVLESGFPITRALDGKWQWLERSE